jgi:hypothetical protein
MEKLTNREQLALIDELREQSTATAKKLNESQAQIEELRLQVRTRPTRFSPLS